MTVQYQRLIKPPIGSKINMNHDLSEGLAGRWLMNEGGGARAHDIVGTSVGVLTNGAVWDSSIGFDKPILFDGVDSYIQLGTDLYIRHTKGTIIAWVNFTDFTDENPIFSMCDIAGGNNGWSFHTEASAKIAIRTFRSSVGSEHFHGGTVLSANTWYQVAITSTGSLWTLYVNTIAETLTALDNPNNGRWFNAVTATTANFRIGHASIFSMAGFYYGYVSDVSVYDYALNKDQLSILYADPYVNIIQPIKRSYFFSFDNALSRRRLQGTQNTPRIIGPKGVGVF